MALLRARKRMSWTMITKRGLLGREVMVTRAKQIPMRESAKMIFMLKRTAARKQHPGTQQIPMPKIWGSKIRA